ncbi:hypothetical protein SISNIDRAFT_500732 [Sistotremastrum niveocremeum HHB9708]|uniref:N-acetyltransferase ECO1 n=1 Tax=Sistotremastrum niveocremeum HHB9708 TaxID=1314777 RepID=A0A165AK01_9AGAM|nr:hypothetical protein SISNIDRAFT_500732 [Sistotremastrum niveocremeum HHB9708]
MSIKRTYLSRKKAAPFTSSPQTSSSPEPEELPQIHPLKRKRPLQQSNILNFQSLPKAKKQKTTSELTQLHFDTVSSLKACSICGLSYTIGAADDVALHKSHCSRVSKGLEWGKEENRAAVKQNVRVIESRLDKVKSRILCVDCSIGGVIGSKISRLLDTINRSLSAPALTPSTLKSSKAYLFLTPTSPTRERIVGCVIASRIEHAMEIASPAEESENSEDLLCVDAGLFCRPELLPTTMGIPRLFVSLDYRRKGIATQLLSAAAATFIHGCVLRPEDGQVAFSQPTSLGRMVMTKWGGGRVRIYEE